MLKTLSSSKTVRASLAGKSQLSWLALTGAAVLATVIGFAEKPASHAASSWPATPPAQICGASGQLSGPATAPAGAVTVPAGDNSAVNFGRSATYWFAPGAHTLGTDQPAHISPANNAAFIGAPGAILDGQGKNKYAFIQQATGVSIKYLTIQNFGAGSGSSTPSGDNNNEGVVNRDAGQNWTIQHNTIQYNAGAGVVLGSGDVVSDNCLTQNGQYGFSAYDPDGVSNVTLNHNEISGNDTYDWESHGDGCGCTGGGKFWAVQGAVVTNNYVHDNHAVGIWAGANNAGFDIESNYISNNFAEGIIYETSYNFLIKNNNFIRNALGSGPKDTRFPHPAVYISESGSDSRVAGNYNTGSGITGNNFTDNWSGVILWENSERYCSSTASPAAGDCTLVNPGVANITNCANANFLKTPPYISDCRWKTQNVNVTANTFNTTPATIGSNCTKANACGVNGVFAQWGSIAPYTGAYVEDNITYQLNNRWSNNTYTGAWNFMAHEQGAYVTWDQWRASPYNQDSKSTMTKP